jgi:methylmalonyl-CoA mutase N-terminal domain/subunit
VAWREAISQVESAWREGRNMVPVLMEALRARATMGELNEAMRRAQDWKEPAR